MKEYKEIERLLKEKYPVRVELHAHTWPASSCADFPAEEVVEKYKKIGYDAIVITNHFLGGNYDMPKDAFLKFYLKDFEKARIAGEKLGIKVLLGAELRFANDEKSPFNDYLLYGCSEEDLSSIYDVIDSTLENFVKKAKKPEHLLVQAHPLRQNMVVRDAELLDGYESFNMHPGHNASISLATRLAKQKNKLFIAGTDFHHKNHEGCAAVRFNHLPSDEQELAAMIKENDFLIEIEGCILLA